MDERVLVLTQPGDLHACLIAAVLRRKRATALLWNTTDFPTRAFETVRVVGRAQSFTLQTADLRLDPLTFGVVWNRRAAHALDDSVLHPADQEFAELQCRLFRRSLFDLLAPEAFWVNPDNAAARATKLLQLSVAAKVGLRTPDTIFTNDPGEIRAFLQEHGGQAVYKTFASRPWTGDGGTVWMPYTSVVSEELLVEEDILQRVPGIYQALVPKTCDVRIVVMGRQAMAVRILSQETAGGKVDWRRACREVRMEEHGVPQSLSTLCTELLRRLGLVFGCFDFAVTPEGEHVFLEVNQMGQFLFLESFTGQPVLDAFGDFLLAADPDFEWSGSSVPIRYQDVEEEAKSLLDQTMTDHVQAGRKVWDECPAPSKGRRSADA